MTEPVDGIEALRAERDELREELSRAVGTCEVPQILMLPHLEPDLFEDVARMLDEAPPRPRRVAGWGSTGTDHGAALAGEMSDQWEKLNSQ
jgi:hypothetical protein